MSAGIAGLPERVARCLPAGTYELETLVRICGVHASQETATAAVTCGPQPRLLVNPGFVDQNCRRDEHLFLLVMHELWHVILAHTALYPRTTAAENVAFDAVINAGLARTHPEAEFRGFFERLNPADTLPGAFLRPPPGWPRSPRVPESVTGTARRLVTQLYDRDRPAPTYGEILDVLRTPTADGALLLGNHDVAGAPGAGGPGPLDDRLFGDVVRRIVASWPPPPVPIGGRDLGGRLNPWQAAVGAPPPRAATAAFASVLRRVLGPLTAPEAPAREPVVVAAGTGVVPNPRDRLAPARGRLGVAGLWVQPQAVPVRLGRPRPCSNVYLDVSGSMFALLVPLLGLLAPYVRGGRARLWQFSTEVAALTVADVKAGRLSTTGGTDIDCVLEHMLEPGAPRRALVVTDGYTGAGRAALHARMRRSGRELHAVLPSESAWTGDLEGFATTLTVLPAITQASPG